MAFDDFLEPEVAATAVVAAAVFSPRGRKILRRGVVYGLAGILAAGGTITSFSRNIGRGLQSAGASATQATRDLASQAKAGAEEAGTSISHAAKDITSQNKPESSTDETTKSNESSPS